MYTRQVAVALLVGGGVAAVALGSYGLQMAAAGGVLAYLLVRWLLATYHRTRYWLGRGTQGIRTRTCPNCNRSRYRVSGDWILHCHKCGWTAGWPGVRWLTRSVPAMQFRRSVSGLGGFVAGSAVTVLALGQPQSSASGVALPETSVALPQLPSQEEVAIAVGVMVAVFVVILYGMRPRQYYCANCGQNLGRGVPEKPCNKCGSNRYTDEDPGVGEKIRIEHMD